MKQTIAMCIKDDRFFYVKETDDSYEVTSSPLEATDFRRMFWFFRKKTFERSIMNALNVKSVGWITGYDVRKLFKEAR